MKKLLFILLTILITFPLIGQELRLQQNHGNQLIRKSISTDTIDTKDTVYIIEYRHNNFYNINRPCFNRYNINFRYSYNNWYNDDFHWSYNHNWYYINYHRHYNKARQQRPNGQRTIATRIKHKPEKREHVRPVRTTDTRYNRQQNTTRPKQIKNTRSPVNRQTSTYSKPSSNRTYNTPARSNNNRSGSTTRNNSSNRSSSESRGRR